MFSGFVGLGRIFFVFLSTLNTTGGKRPPRELLLWQNFFGFSVFCNFFIWRWSVSWVFDGFLFLSPGHLHNFLWMQLRWWFLLKSGRWSRQNWMLELMWTVRTLVGFEERPSLQPWGLAQRPDHWAAFHKPHLCSSTLQLSSAWETKIAVFGWLKIKTLRRLLLFAATWPFLWALPSCCHGSRFLPSALGSVEACSCRFRKDTRWTMGRWKRMVVHNFLSNNKNAVSVLEGEWASPG